jgi:uncharacterized SAM-binding protein YcdF (DUF218 family)
VATNFGGEPLDAGQDLVGPAIRGMSFALLLGSAIVALVLFTVRLLVTRDSSSELVDQGVAPALLLGGTLAAMAASALAAWVRLAPIGSYYRRGGLSMVCGFGTFVVAVLAAPLHHFLGTQGLLGMAAVSLVGLAVLGRKLR